MRKWRQQLLQCVVMVHYSWTGRLAGQRTDDLQKFRENMLTKQWPGYKAGDKAEDEAGDKAEDKAGDKPEDEAGDEL